MVSVRLCASVAVLLSLATSTAAQSTTGDIQGTIADGSRTVLPAVTVTITNTATGIARETITDSDGFFAAPGLPVGPYEVQASAQGFATQRQMGLVVHAGEVITLRLELGVAAAPETITVAGPVPVVRATRSHASATVDSAEVEHLPARDRDARTFALLTPGVTLDVRSSDITVAGQPATLNRVVVDGADRKMARSIPHGMHQEAVQEVQVAITAYPAEYGRAGAGIINLVTKSGSNDLNGSVFQFLGDTEFGAAVGAPIVKNKHFVYGTYDARRLTDPNPVFLNLPGNTPTDAATQSAIDRLGLLTAPWDRTQDDDLFLIKTDHEVADNQRVTIRYSRDVFQARGLDRGPNVAAESSGSVETSAHAFTATAASAIGTALFNEARFSILRDRESGESSGEPQATIRQSGTDVLRIGHNVFSSGEVRVRRFQVSDTLTWIRGAHKVKAGLDFQFDNVVSLVPGNFSGSYVFGALAGFARRVPNAPGEAYTQAFEGPGTPGRSTRPDTSEYSLFAQDEWRINRELTVNAGVRYDAQTCAQADARNPDGQLAAAGIDTSAIHSDRSNLGPRLGIAWAPVDRRLVVRGGYGLVYGSTPWTMVAAAQANNGINVQTVTFRGANGDPVPAFPNRFAAMPAGRTWRPTIVVFDHDYQNPRVQHLTAGFEWEWMPDSALSANYLMLRGDRLARPTDVNIGTAVPTTLTVVDPSGNASGSIPHARFAPGPFANFARVISYESTAQSRYNGVTFELTRRFAQGHQYRLAYTLGKVEDTKPGVTAVVPESLDDRKLASSPADPEMDRAPGDHDHRHRFVASAIYDSSRIADRFNGLMRAVVNDWMLSVVYSAQSGAPYSAYASTDINGDNNRFNDLAPGTTRNQYRGPAASSLDPRVARDIELKGDTRVTIIWETFNLLNRLNDFQVNDTLYDVAGQQLRLNPLFGEVLPRSERRAMRFAVKFLF